MRVDGEAIEIEEFAAGTRPFRALYEHWERHQWSPFAIDIGVSYARQRLARDGTHAREVITEVVEGFQLLGQTLLENTDADLRNRFVNAYGADPEALWAEVLRHMRLRLRSIGLGEVAG